eukprot:6011321-Amphidinium_carterae.1
MPKFLQTKCTSYGLFTSIQILARLLREIMPTADHSRLSLTKDIQDVNQKLPATLQAADRWLDDYLAKLAMAQKLKCPVEPRIILTVVNKALEKPLETDRLLRDIWSDHSRNPEVRNPTTMLPVVSFAEIMLGEVRLAIREDRLRNNIQSVIPGNNSNPRAPYGAGMQADDRKDCAKFFSNVNEGCKYGQKCRDRHPETP